MSKIQDLEPKNIWKNFYDLTQIPRPSKKEERIQEFMMNFGKNIGLETLKDDIGNILIRKPATLGMENRKGVIFQGHLDMVPQKNNDTDHNFETDTIKAFIDGEWITAKGTTLGADNGVGVAAAMAVLESKEIEHGPVEALFTCDEETGMTGAFNLKPNWIQGDILLNLDSEDEGELYVGCAGGLDVSAYIKYKEKPSNKNSKAYKISVGGLKGGHSGIDIPLERGNANKVLNRILWTANKKFNLNLVDISGGSLRNAIPREAAANVVVRNKHCTDFEKHIDNISAIIKNELASVDPGLEISCEKTDLPEMVIRKKFSNRFLNAVYSCPHGVIRKTPEMPEIPETSTNMAIVKTANGKFEIHNLLRSSMETAKDNAANMMIAGFMQAKAKVKLQGGYPGWKPNMQSPILQTMKDVYKEHFGKTPDVKLIHAGLECGLLGDVYPNWDMISFGPTIRYPHSPDEKVNIASVQKFWDYLVLTLKNIPKK